MWLTNRVALWLAILSVLPLQPVAPQERKVYLPLMIGEASFGRGVAIAYEPELEHDLELLNVSWFYVYGEWRAGDPRNIPMIRQDEATFPSSCYPRLLIFNEPDSQRPFDPAQTAQIVHNIEAACPNTYLIVGNVSAGGQQWIIDFLSAYGPNFRQALGVHCYGQTSANWCKQVLAGFLSLYVGPWWLTEYNVFYSVDGFRELTEWARDRFVGVAPYTNREPCCPSPWWALGEKAWLVDANGNLTPNGEVYANVP